MTALGELFIVKQVHSLPPFKPKTRMLKVNILISRTKEIVVDLVFIRRMMRLHNRCVSRAFLFHRNEWSVAFVILIVFLSVRLDKAVENARAKVKLDD